METKLRRIFRILSLGAVLFAVGPAYPWTGVRMRKSSSTPPPEIVQKTSSYLASDSISKAYSSSVYAGNLLVACYYGDNRATKPTISDTQSNTWNEIFWTNSGVGEAQMICWYAADSKAGSTTVSIYGDGVTFSLLALYELSGLDRTSPLDSSGTALGLSGDTNVTVSTSGSVTKSTGLVLVSSIDWGNFQTWSYSAGYTLREQVDANSGKYIVSTGDKDAKTGLSGVQSVTITRSNTGHAWVGGIMAFKGRSD
jgi:hypothetical protein